MSLGKRIPELRGDLGISQSQLAREAGLSQGYLSQIENDEVKNPSAFVLFRLAQALQIDPQDLLITAGYLNEEEAETYGFLLDLDLLRLVSSLPVSSQEAVLQLCSFWSGYKVNSDHPVTHLLNSATIRKKATGNLGGKIRELRERASLSQGQLANNADINQGYLSQLENDGVKKPSAAVILRIARTLEMAPDELFSAAGLPTLEEIRQEYEQLISEIVPELAVFLQTLSRSAQRSLWLLLLDMKTLLIKTEEKKVGERSVEMSTTP